MKEGKSSVLIPIFWEESGFFMLRQEIVSLSGAFSIVYFGEGRMEAETLASVTQVNCKHERQLKYTERIFDVLNGFEIVAVRCYNCHKTIELTIRKLTSF